MCACVHTRARARARVCVCVCVCRFDLGRFEAVICTLGFCIQITFDEITLFSSLRFMLIKCITLLNPKRA